MAAADRYAFSPVAMTQEPRHAAALSLSDSVELAYVSRYLVATVAGVVKVTTVDGDVAVIPIAAGIPLPIRAKLVWSTGTTATGIVALD